MAKQKQSSSKLKEKKKTASTKRINMSVPYTEKDAVATVTVIRERLKAEFRRHIGKDNAITPYDLYVAVMKEHPEMQDVYQRTYWWNVIRKIMQKLRAENDVFIVAKGAGTGYYVLQTSPEAEEYAKRMDMEIRNFRNSKLRAYEWVKDTRWKSF